MKTKFKELIAISPIMAMGLFATIYFWIKGGWLYGMIVPGVIILSILMERWVNFWFKECEDDVNADNEVKEK